ncbi:MAG: DNA polymerase/3'-5' exonuclease PolX, partial [Patescibacteria group bacterium]
IAKVFADMAIYYAMDGESFRARAHERVADTISKLDLGLNEIYQKGGVKALQSDIDGVGSGLAADIEELLKTGQLNEHSKFKKKFPIDLDQLSRIEGLGPKSLVRLYKELNIRTVADLQKAANAGKIRELSGFGEKSEQHMLRSLASVDQTSNEALLGDVLPFARHLRERITAVSGVKKIEIAGSLRRMKETVGDIDLIAVASHPEKLMEYFVAMPEVIEIKEHGPTRSIVRLSNGFDCDLRVVPSVSFGAALLYFTGNREHTIALRTRALEKGMTLNEYGLYKGHEANGDPIASATEKEVYKALGLSYVEPELREMNGEIELAEKGTLPDLISYKSLKGDFQVQTDWTDGSGSVEDMAYAAQRAGLEYITITDHTKTLTVTTGLDEKRLEAQSRLIDRLNEKLKGITILKGAEVNILKDGTLDISDEALHKLDVVGISVHSHFNLSKEEQTQRIIRALEHPSVNILFHPTGRRINRREPYEIDMDAILKAAKNNNVAVEIDSYFNRLDLKDSHIRLAIKYEVMLTIDSDSHSPAHFSYLEYGIGQARRGGAKESNILNTRSVKDVKKFLRKKRNQKG